MRGKILFALVFILEGCSSQKAAVINPHLPPQDVSIAGNETTLLGDALTYSETTESNEIINVNWARHLPEADYVSKITVRPDKEKLKLLFSESNNILPPITKDLREIIRQGPVMLKMAETYVYKAQEVNNLAKVAGTDSEKIKQAIREQAQIALDILNPIKAIVEAQAKEKFGDLNTPQAAIFINQQTEKLFRDDTNTFDVLLNIRELSKFFDNLRVAVDQANKDAQIAESQGMARLRLRAWLRTHNADPVAISVENYDDIEDPKGLKTPRIAMRMRPSDQVRVEEGQRLNEAILETYEKFVKDKELRKFDIQSLLDRLRANLSAIAPLKDDLLEKADVQATLSQIIAAFEPKATHAERQDIENLKRFIKQFGELHVAINDLNNYIPRLQAAATKSPSAILEMTLAVPRSLAEGIGILSNSFNGAIAGLKILMNQTAIKLNSQQKLLIAEIQKEVAKFIEGLPAYKELNLLVGHIAVETYPNHLAEKIDYLKVDARVKPLFIDKALPGTVNLNNTPADKGSRVEIRAEILGTENGQEKIIERTSQILRVERFGWTDSFSAPLIFVKRLSTPTGESATNFAPRPSAAWSLHYKPRILPGTEAPLRVLDFLSPGFGLNVAALDFNNNGVQVGVGVQGSLFRELITVGYGYNLNVSKNREYFFIGIGILELLETVGIRTKN